MALGSARISARDDNKYSINLGAVAPAFSGETTMRFRPFLHASAAASLSATMFIASPSLAQDGYDYRGADYVAQMDPGAREAWLADCRSRLSRQDSGLGGAAIGGVIGGVAGNRIAGRGSRTVGTIAGAAVGAAAGIAIDKSEDRGRIRDECEAYLEDYYARYSGGYQGHGYPGYGYPAGGPGYAPQGYYPYQGHYPAYAAGCCAPMMAVPVATRGEPQCTETVEYVYEDVPVSRPAPRRAAPQKRVKVVPDKRVRTK